jgi:hypothetical protein
MENVNTEQISKEINDTLIHRACVMRSGKYLAKYLIHCGRSVDAIRLLARCSIHDISKLQNTEEFLCLASIVDEMGDMHDTSHVLSPAQIKATKLHHDHNDHHIEFHDSPNDMTEMQMMELACDLHARSKQFGTNLMDYVNKQQEIRFHFDSRHLNMLKRYSMALVDLTKNDDYSIIFNDAFNIAFDFKDSSMRKLEAFDVSQFPGSIKTDNLFLRKEDTADFATVAYSINTREENDKIGNIIVKFNGYIEFKIFENYKYLGYATEAISSLINSIEMAPICVVVRKEDTNALEMFQNMGFVPGEFSGEQITLRYTKPKEKALVLTNNKQ